MIPLVVVVATALVAHEVPAFCAEARALVADDAALTPNDAVRALSRALGQEAPRVVEQADRVSAAHGDLASALPVYTHAVTTLCDTRPPANAVDARAAARAILDDPVFAGQRAKSDIFDLLVARGRALLLAFLESAGMQQYAGFSRGLYLFIVCTGAFLLALRVLRERRRRVRVARETERSAPPVHRSVRTARALLDDAERARARGALAEALALGEAALLAVLPGDEEQRGRTRTHGEILRALPGDRARAVSPLLTLLGRALFGAGALDDEGADARTDMVRAFLDGVRAHVSPDEGARA